MAYEDANSLTLTGKVVGDAEYSVDMSGSDFCRFFVEYSYRYKTPDGWATGVAEIPCKYHRLTEWFRANITDGLRVCIQGRLVQDEEGYFMVDLSYLKII